MLLIDVAVDADGMRCCCNGCELVMVVLEMMENDGALGGDNVVVLVRTYIILL